VKLPAKGALFLNRSSGVNRSADAEAMERAAEEAGLEIVPIGPEGNCFREVRDRMARGVKLFVAAGGDGTVHHVMQALVNSDAELGVIPLGTYNHFARDLGIPLEWPAALEVALSGARAQVDTARINDRFFVNNVSIGLYPELVARREEHGRDYPRWKARLYAIYMTLRKYPHVTMNVEAEHRHLAVRTHLFMVSNNHYDLEKLGAEAFRTSLTEGRIAVYWLPHTSRLRLMRYAARYLAGRVREIPGFRSFRTMRIRVQTSRDHLKVGVDGEVFTMTTPLVITTVPQSLSVRVPR
jgi:YegS/Rv2252/BmrU family lipid kinase